MAYLETNNGPMVIIHDGNYTQFIPPRDPNAVGNHGLVPRPAETKRVGYYSKMTPPSFPLISQADLPGWITQKDKDQSWSKDVRMTAGPNGSMIPSRDQNGKGYCWAHSGVSAHLLARAVMGQPYADLSAYAIACQIKNFADEGGWGAQGLDWQMQNGVPTSATWPQQSMSRSNVNDAMKTEAKLHLLTAQVADMDAQEYDRNLAYAQYCTLFVRDCPCVVDFNWWSHSVCGCFLSNGSSNYGRTRCATSHKLLDISEHDKVWAVNHPVTAGIATGIWNSWGDSWSNQGMGLLTGSQAIPDGGAGILTVMAS